MPKPHGNGEGALRAKCLYEDYDHDEDYDISIKGASSSFTTFSSPTGQITMAAGSTTLNGTNTLFQSELSINDIIQTFSENMLVEDDEGIVM